MWKFKNEIYIGITFFSITFIFSALVNSIDITVTNLYSNVQLYFLVIIIYFIAIKKNIFENVLFNLHKYSKSVNFYKFHILQFSLFNLIFSGFVYFTFLLASLFFGGFLLDIEYSYLFPFHQFLIFEIIYIIVLSRFESKYFNFWYYLFFIITILMYIGAALNDYSSISSLNLFLCFFKLRSFSSQLIHYGCWIIISLILLNWKNKEIEL